MITARCAMFRVLYTIVFILALPAIFSRLWWKDKKVPGYRIRWPERFGIFPKVQTQRPLVWVHAVSVGEVIAATPLVKRLLAEDKVDVMVTTMTPTGSERVNAAFGHQVHHVYAPYDLPWTVRAFLRRCEPRLAIIMETELWPNVLNVCAQHQLPVLLANARLSQRSAKGYGRFSRTTREIFNQLDRVAVQNDDDAARFITLGLAPEKLTVTGSVKFDVQIPDSLIAAARQLKTQYSQQGKRPVIIAASTHDNEESSMLTAFSHIKQRFPNALLLLVPRHPERFDPVAALSEKRFRTLRRSARIAPTMAHEVVVCDTMGEMMMLYGCADIAFVGGSLVARGGHNMIEPASWGLPIICGPHTFNFADITKRLKAVRGMVEVADPAQLCHQIEQWLENPDEARSYGGNALRFAEENRGAIDRLMELIDSYLASPSRGLNNSPTNSTRRA